MAHISNMQSRNLANVRVQPTDNLFAAA